MTSKTVTDKEYFDLFEPIGSWILVEKDAVAEKIGSIYVPPSVQESTKFSGTGVIRGLPNSEWNVFDRECDEYFISRLRIGDRVGFSLSTPMMSPTPPSWCFESGTIKSARFVQLIVTDITCVIFDTPKQRQEWDKRLKDENRKNKT